MFFNLFVQIKLILQRRQRAGTRCSKADLSLCEGTASRAYPVALAHHLETSIFNRRTHLRSKEGGGIDCSAITIPSSLAATPEFRNESKQAELLVDPLGAKGVVGR
jgi:hypothetical protein